MMQLRAVAVAVHTARTPAVSPQLHRCRSSTAGDIVSAQRSCLFTEHVDMLVFLKTNAHLID